MPIISVRDNENNRWKRNTKEKKNQKTNKDRKEPVGTEDTVKEWEHFVVHLSWVFFQYVKLL